MPKFLPLFAATFLLAGFLTGCASTVKTNVASYGDPQQISKGQSLALIPADTGKTESLEFKHYRDQLKEKLQAAGYRIVEPSQRPDLLAEFDYTIMPPRQQTNYYRQRPVFGPFGGFAYGYRTGPWRRHTYRRTYLGYSFPLGGYDDYEETRSSTTTYYDRTVSLIVHKPSETKRLYESRINGSSTCSQTEPVMNVLIDRMATQFPNPAQQSQTIELPRESC